MKKLFLIAVLLLGMLTAACSKQKALDNILADPEMKSYLLKQMLGDESTRAEMADSILADENIVTAYLSGMAEMEISRGDLLSYIMAVDTTGEWTIGKLSENPEFKKIMKQAVRK